MTKKIYWIITALTAALMLIASVPDVLRTSEAIEFFNHLGYPSYLLPFLGFAKMLGVIVILVPGLPRLKEWAYAGLVFDLIGAFYSHISVGDPVNYWIFPLIALGLVMSSYFLSHARLQTRSDRRENKSVTA
jgi:hypothetical protein